jgi:putative phosphoribosyl transferase
MEITMEHINPQPIFTDREDALKRLIELLPVKQMQEENWIVVAISMGGVLFAKKIADILHAPFDFLFTEPITAPNNTECQIAMVSETEEIVIHDALAKAFDIKLDYIYDEAHRKYEERIIAYMYRYRKGDMISSLTHKHVLLVDEGIDSGLTMMASVKTAINLHARSVSFAVPVMPLDVFERLEEVIDEVYCVHKPASFVDVPYYYNTIPALSVEKIDTILKDIHKG